ncbi:alpha/beta fold hydrolase [Ruania zhangjianzhongii]|uniref:alpha/beta fold hydrolase n=1 Tax=Ruania zhangjianzhongii TaxID=2603206 RepID=UPI0011CCB95E|nr:alpha/beta hydrolase [Ruania zhangjianzhongii]
MTNPSSAVESVTISADGTPIHWQHQGTGPGLVLVDAVLFGRATSPSAELIDPLAEMFTVITYDRRGKGDSGDTPPWSPAREAGDLVAVIEAAAISPVNVYGLSSGGTLALYAAANGAPIDRLVVLEPPLGPLPGVNELEAQLTTLVEAGDGAEAIRIFHEFQGMPDEVIEQLAPMRAALAPAAGTIRYDTTLSNTVTDDLLALVAAPTLALSSQASPPLLTDFAARVGTHAPRAEHRSLPGDWHGLSTGTLVSAIREFCLI